MKLIDTKCPGCGAQMLVDRAQKKAFCVYCSTVLAMDEEELGEFPAESKVASITSSNAEESGYRDEKQRMKAIEEAKEQAELEQRLQASRDAQKNEELRMRIMVSEEVRKAEAAVIEKQKFEESQKEQRVLLLGFLGAVGLIVLFPIAICLLGGLLSNFF